jgi:hypothetical protein
MKQGPTFTWQQMVGNLFHFIYQYADLLICIYYFNNQFLWKGVEIVLMNTKCTWNYLPPKSMVAYDFCHFNIKYVKP